VDGGYRLGRIHLGLSTSGLDHIDSSHLPDGQAILLSPLSPLMLSVSSVLMVVMGEDTWPLPPLHPAPSLASHVDGQTVASRETCP